MGITALIQQLRTGDFRQQAEAAEALAQSGDSIQAAIPALVQYSGHEDESVSNWCVAALEEAGPPSETQLEDLTALAQAADANVAYWAITSLGRAQERASGAISVLVQRMQDTTSSPGVQQRAAWALGQIGRGSAATATALKAAAATEGPLATHAKRALDRLLIA